jgi:hypothetical protein
MLLIESRCVLVVAGAVSGLKWACGAANDNDSHSKDKATFKTFNKRLLHAKAKCLIPRDTQYLTSMSLVHVAAIDSHASCMCT